MSVPKRPACPICKEPSVEAYKPFCSRRCADVDLGRWFVGSYAIPGRDEDESDALRGETDADDNAESARKNGRSDAAKG